MKLPLDFGIKLFFRLLLPGFLLVLGLLPLLLSILDLTNLEKQREIAFIVSMIVAGWLIVVADMPIYMLLEGRHGWPTLIKRKLINHETGRLDRISRAIDDFYAVVGEPDDETRRRYLEASVKKRSFPLHQASGERYVEFPTRLGNAIHAYETYSKVMYGVEAIFYWPRIWVNLSKDLREEVDTHQAMADSTVYSCFALGVAGSLWTFYTAFSAGQALLAPFFGDAGIARSLPPGILPYLPGAAICLLIAAIFLGLACGVYHLSVHTNEQFGTLFMAIIDSHAGRVQKEYVNVDAIVRMTEHLTEQPSDKSEKFEIARRYLQYYTVKLQGQKRPVPVPKVRSSLGLGILPVAVQEISPLPGEPQDESSSAGQSTDASAPDPKNTGNNKQ